MGRDHLGRFVSDPLFLTLLRAKAFATRGLRGQRCANFVVRICRGLTYYRGIPVWTGFDQDRDEEQAWRNGKVPGLVLSTPYAGSLPAW